MRTRSLFAAIAIAMTSEIAAHAQAQGLVKYTVESDTHCDDLAEKLWGDRQRYDLIHANNPWLGPPPHTLKAGTVLTIPPPVVKATTGPDAKLQVVRNDVAVEAPTPRRGKPEDPLFRGNKVGTALDSSAEVGFHDDTTLWLGERSLVVILGDSRSKVGKAGEATLERGDLRAFLAGQSKPLSLSAAEASVSVGVGEAKISLDPKRTTRLAVYRGESALSSAGKTTKVAQGFGSKAEDKKAPSPPKPLPPAPTWSTPLTPIAFATGPAVDLSAEYMQGAGAGGAAATWHVQVARDAGFHDLLVDAKVPAAVHLLGTKGAKPGSYFARASAIDADEFEGPYGVATSTDVVAIEPGGDNQHHARLVLPSNRFACSVDGGALAVVTAPLELSRTRAHRVACGDAPNGAGAKETVIPAETLGVRVTSPRVDVASDGASGTLAFTLVDAAGAPVSDSDVVANGDADVVAGAPVSKGGGSYEVPVRWKSPRRALSLAVVVNGSETVKVTDVPLGAGGFTAKDAKTAAASDAARKDDAPPSGAHAEVGIALSGSVIGDPLDTGALGATADLGLVLPAGPVDFAADLALAYERYLGTHDERDAFVAEIPVSLRLGRGRVRPVLSLGGLVARAASLGHTDGVLFGGEARGGVELRVGAGAWHVDAGYRLTTRDTSQGTREDLTGIVWSLGYRYEF